jgi:hypothetical protein
MALEISEVRRRVRGAIESARRTAQERRVRNDRAAADYADFLRDRAVPAFQTVAAALVAEGQRFHVHTPAGSVRLAAEASAEDFIELTLDTTTDPPAVLARINRGRGRRLVTAERHLNDAAAVDQLTDEDVVSLLIAELPAFIER